MKKLIFGTGNKGKAREVKKIFADTNYEVLSLHDLGFVPEIIEDGKTFEDNAVIKAKEVYHLYKQPVIADDSGLAIEQLEGRPGVHSARYAGDNCTYADNNHKVLEELENFNEPHRAKFICFAVYFDGASFKKAVGKLEGKIIKEFRGTNGFGYDPIFIPDGYTKTLAELDINEKNLISHRAEAFNKLKKLLISGEK